MGGEVIPPLFIDSHGYEHGHTDTAAILDEAREGSRKISYIYTYVIGLNSHIMCDIKENHIT